MSGTRSTGGNQRENSPLSSPRFIAAAVFLLVIALAAGWLVGSESSDEPAVPTPSEAVASEPVGSPEREAPPVDEGASVCGLEPGDQQVPVTAPQAQIETVAPGISVPVVEGVGPGVRDGISRCFAHSPSGAVLASVNWLKWFSSQQQMPEVITMLMAEGEDRDRLARQVDDGWDGSTSTPAQVHGFKVDVRSQDEILVTLAVSTEGSPDEGLVSWPVLMRWEGGDWKVVAPQSNSWGQEPVSSVASGGFTDWSV